MITIGTLYDNLYVKKPKVYSAIFGTTAAGLLFCDYSQKAYNNFKAAFRKTELKQEKPK